MTVNNYSELIIDNDRLKILKYIKRSKSTTLSKLRKKFNADENLMFYLVNQRIIICTNPLRKTNEYGECWIEYEDSSIFKLDTKGKYIVENDIVNNREWKIPVIISAIALLKSFDKELINLFKLIYEFLSNI